MSNPDRIPVNPEKSPLRAVTLHDIARKLGVSYVTVSLALRDRGRISDALRAKIKRVAGELNYRPDPTARALVQYRSSKPASSIHSVLAWFNLWSDPKKLRSFREFDRYWTGAYAAADAAGYRLEEFTVDQEMSLSRLQTILRTRQVRGGIIPPHRKVIDWKEFDWRDFSVVRIGHTVPSPPGQVVSPDQVGNTILAFRRMRALGYERIGFVGPREWSLDPTRWFSGGFLMMQLREPVRNRIPPLVLDGAQPEEAQLKRLSDWMQRHRPDAVLSEVASLRAMLGALGFEIPRDIGMAALSVLDGNADAGIYQNPEQIGSVAAEIAIAQIMRDERQPSSNFRMTLIPGTWVDGSTLPSKSPDGSADGMGNRP
jgi:DNA-binding LacI/PurR family transcriptional regulator